MGVEIMGEYQTNSMLPIGTEMPWVTPAYTRYPYGIKGSTKNEKGHYVSGEVLFEFERYNTASSKGPNASVSASYQVATLGGLNSTTPMCIIAIPQYCAGYRKIYDGDASEQTQCMKNFFELNGKNPSWTYVIACKGTLKLADSWRMGGVLSLNTWNGYFPYNNPNFEPDKGRMGTSTSKSILGINNLVNSMNNFNGENITFQTVTVQAGLYLDTNLKPNGINYYYPPSYNVGYATGEVTADCQIAARVTATIPVFNILDYQSIIDYFDTGDISGADNMEDLQLSDVSLATDWVIYVKGARYPDIYVTMSSKELDAFIESENNKTGLSASDFKVEYKYFYSPDTIIANPEYRYWKNTPYNDTMSTSYKELYTLEEGMWDDETETARMQDYVRLQFRIYYNDNTFSRWCYFKIGYIGSPSVPNFSKMQNEGGVVSIDDGSTVTIIYDELPPDDEYEKPNDDSDIGNDSMPRGDTNEGLNLLTVSYNVTKDNVDALGDFLWNSTLFDNIKLLNNSPIENIVGLKVMPCAVSSQTSSIVIGNIDTKINGDVVTNVPIINIGSFSFKGYYGNFLDYSPYTKVTIFLPFIGFTELDPAQFTGHTLNVKYAFDIVMGQCKAMLFVDNIYVHSLDGICGIDVPLVASNRAQVEGGTIASMAGAALQGDVVQTVSSYALRQYHSSRTGGYSSTLGWAETREVYLVLEIPNAQYPTTYGHDIGYPCNLSCNLGTLSGFTVCAPDIDLSGFTCTEAEKEQIRQLLTTGVYL